jgi:hypothetical protein
MNILINAIPFYVEHCYSCQIAFAIPRPLFDARQADGKEFYCPSGHGQRYTKSKVMILEEEKVKIARDRDWNKQKREETEAANARWARRYNGLLGQLARARRKR